MAWTKVANAGELPRDSVIEVEHAGKLYAVCNSGGELHALAGVCPHQGGPLGEGTLLSGMLICPWHMWEFDAKTGACLVDDRLRLPTFPAQMKDGAIIVDFPGRNA